MVITWPNRTTQTLLDLKINSVNTILQADTGKTINLVPLEAHNTKLERISAGFDKHTEDDYIDFYYERNIPKMLSREGPHATCADVNGDGLMDIYIAGAMQQPGQLYIQNSSGFQNMQQALFDQFADFEDVAVLFFDCDNDKDQDLFIGSGGNNVQVGGRNCNCDYTKMMEKEILQQRQKHFPITYTILLLQLLPT